MKKSELTHIVEQIVAEEIRKQLPKVLTEVFSNLIEKRKVVSETIVESKMVVPQELPKEEEEEAPVSMKQSLREMFSGTPVVAERPAAPVKKIFTKNSVLNDILNQTSPFNGIARMQMGMGAGAAMAAMSAGVSMGDSMTSNDGRPSFSSPTSIPVGRPPVLTEDQASTHIPLGDLGEISALDVKELAPPAVSAALSRNYRSMMKLIDKKKKGIQ